MRIVFKEITHYEQNIRISYVSDQLPDFHAELWINRGYFQSRYVVGYPLGSRLYCRVYMAHIQTI